MSYPSLSVIVPCYNEEAIIFNTIATIHTFLYQKNASFEIIAVSDGSIDKTVSEIKRAKKHLQNVRLIDNPINHGKGQAIKDGVLQSRNEIIVFIDADLTVSIEELQTFLPALETHDIVIASRALPKTIFEEDNPWYRIFLAQGFRFFQTLILGNSDIKDTQCGFKVFKREMAKKIFKQLTIKRFAFDAEALFLAKQFGYTIKQLPIIIHKDTRESHINAITDPINMLFALIKIRLNALLGRYDNEIAPRSNRS